jgi:hypothetical protein
MGSCIQASPFSTSIFNQNIMNERRVVRKDKPMIRRNVDTHGHSPWHFKLSQASLDLHPGVLAIGRI